jgi:hypothetical protein
MAGVMLQKYMNTENNKKYILGLLWLAYGYLAWVCGVHLNSYFEISNIFSLTRKYIRNTYHSYSLDTLTLFITSNITEFTIMLAFAILLSFATGKKRLWIFLFILGGITRSLYISVELLIAYKYYYDKIPSWGTTALIQFFTADLIVIPALIWLGASLGNKYHKQKPA